MDRGLRIRDISLLLEVALSADYQWDEAGTILMAGVVCLHPSLYPVGRRQSRYWGPLYC